MFQKAIFILILSASLIPSIAQDSKVTTGVIAYQQQDYEKAIKSFDEALQKPASLKPTNLPKVYFYRGNSYFQMYQKAAREKNQVILDKYKDALLQAYSDFQQARESDEGDWKAKANSQLFLLRPSLLQIGLSMLNYSYQKGISDSDKSKALQTAENYLTKTIEIKDNDYVPHDLLGQVYYQNTDFRKARSHFLDAKKYYQLDPPKTPDFLIGYVYYRAATIYRYYLNDQNEDLDAALQSIQEGKNVLEYEYERFTKMKSSYNGAQIQRLEQQYQNAKNDLSKLELDIYLNAPEKYHDALEKFKKAVEEEPDNYIVYVAYAQLLEASDVKAAIEIYKNAISIDGSKTIAHFNLGAIYVNRAAELSRVAHEQINLDEAEVYNQQSLESLRKAKPHMENALKTAPGELAIINALLNICINLDQMDDYQKYSEMKKQIEGN